MSPDLHRVFIGLGSNLGDREGNILRAFEWLREQPALTLDATSQLMETAPWGVEDQPPFINAAAVVRTTLSPQALLKLLKDGEKKLGRAPDGPRWGPRVIDLDILLFGNQTLHSEELTIPHGRLTERAFVMAQIVELDPSVVHPSIGRTVLSLLGDLK